MPKQQNWGFDLTNLDPKVRPQDDFFHHVSGGWLKKNPIPETESRWGTFVKLRYEVDLQLKEIMTELTGKKKFAKGTGPQMLRDYYLSGMDIKKRDALGITPLSELRSKIEKVSSIKELTMLAAELHIKSVGVFWNVFVEQDSKQTTSYKLHMAQGGLGMPDRDYYLKNTPEFVRVRTAYQAYIVKIFTLSGFKKAEAEDAAKRVFALELKLAEASMTKEDSRDDDKTYHKKTLAAFIKLAPGIDWKLYFKQLGATKVDSLIIMQPLFFTKIASLFTPASLSDWKLYATFHLVNDFAGSLSTTLIEAQFAFYGKTLQGLPAMKPLWRRVMGGLNSNLGELMGKEYVNRHFPKEAKKKALLLVHDLIEAYRVRIKNLDWMSPATKKKALKKLAAMNPKIGYPDKWKSYRGLSIVLGDHVGNIIRASMHEHREQMKKLGKPIDRTEWFMTPQTVNAYFAPSLNDIVFPAAILQPPFFGLSLDDALNYGGMGAVIGHELTHGFDDQGSKRDEHGNLKDWWTASDKKKFQAKTKLLVKQYDAYKVADGVPVSGKLTLGENTADLGGAIIAYDAYQRRLAHTGRKIIDGYTPEQRFFTGFAVFECEHSRPEFQKTHALTDPHSPGIFRINGVVTNTDPFYEAYGLKPGDKLYKPTAKRIRIW